MHATNVRTRRTPRGASRGGRWPEAEISFDMSGPDGRSRIVTMKGADMVEAIECAV